METSSPLTSIQTDISPPLQSTQQDSSGLIVALVIVSLLLAVLVIAITVYFIRKRCHYTASELGFHKNYNNVSHLSVKYDNEYSHSGSTISQSNRNVQNEDATQAFYYTLENGAFEHPKEIKRLERKDYHEIQIVGMADTDDYNHLGTGDNSKNTRQKHHDNYDHVSTIMMDHRGYNIPKSDVVCHPQFRNDYDHIGQDYHLDPADHQDHDESDRHDLNRVTDLDNGDMTLRKSKPRSSSVNQLGGDEMHNTVESGYYNIDVHNSEEVYANGEYHSKHVLEKEQEHGGVGICKFLADEQQGVDTPHKTDHCYDAEGELIYENDGIWNEEITSTYEIAKSI